MIGRNKNRHPLSPTHFSSSTSSSLDDIPLPPCDSPPAPVSPNEKRSSSLRSRAVVKLYKHADPKNLKSLYNRHGFVDDDESSERRTRNETPAHAKRYKFVTPRRCSTGVDVLLQALTTTSEPEEPEEVTKNKEEEAISSTTKEDLSVPLLDMPTSNGSFRRRASRGYPRRRSSEKKEKAGKPRTPDLRHFRSANNLIVDVAGVVSDESSSLGGDAVAKDRRERSSPSRKSPFAAALERGGHGRTASADWPNRRATRNRRRGSESPKRRASDSNSPDRRRRSSAFAARNIRDQQRKRSVAESLAGGRRTTSSSAGNTVFGRKKMLSSDRLKSAFRKSVTDSSVVSKPSISASSSSTATSPVAFVRRPASANARLARRRSTPGQLLISKALSASSIEIDGRDKDVALAGTGDFDDTAAYRAAVRRYSHASSNSEGETRVTSRGWANFKAVVTDREVRRSFKKRIRDEFESQQYFGKLLTHTIRVPRQASSSESTNLARRAIFVFGPSASGKSFSLKSKLSQILRVAGWDASLEFHVIDGGLMRDKSVLYAEMNALRESSATVEGVKIRYEGFVDLYSRYFKKRIHGMKDKMFSYLLRGGGNMIVPDTATSLLHDRTWWKIEALRDAGYEIVFTAVVASKSKCEENGFSRERDEGKKYSSIGWYRGMTKVVEMINRSRHVGISSHLPAVIINNDDWGDVRCEVLAPFHVMDWRGNLLQRWGDTSLPSTASESSKRNVVVEAVSKAEKQLVASSVCDPAQIVVDRFCEADISGDVAVLRDDECRHSSATIARRFSVSVTGLFTGSSGLTSRHTRVTWDGFACWITWYAAKTSSKKKTHAKGAALSTTDSRAVARTVARRPRAGTDSVLPSPTRFGKSQSGRREFVRERSKFRRFSVTAKDRGLKIVTDGDDDDTASLPKKGVALSILDGVNGGVVPPSCSGVCVGALRLSKSTVPFLVNAQDLKSCRRLLNGLGRAKLRAVLKGACVIVVDTSRVELLDFRMDTFQGKSAGRDSKSPSTVLVPRVITRDDLSAALKSKGWYLLRLRDHPEQLRWYFALVKALTYTPQIDADSTILNEVGRPKSASLSSSPPPTLNGEIVHVPAGNAPTAPTPRRKKKGTATHTPLRRPNGIGRLDLSGLEDYSMSPEVLSPDRAHRRRVSPDLRKFRRLSIPASARPRVTSLSIDRHDIPSATYDVAGARYGKERDVNVEGLAVFSDDDDEDEFENGSSGDESDDSAGEILRDERTIGMASSPETPGEGGEFSRDPSRHLSL